MAWTMLIDSDYERLLSRNSLQVIDLEVGVQEGCPIGIIFRPSLAARWDSARSTRSR
jgi:hypothetical protein